MPPASPSSRRQRGHDLAHKPSDQQHPAGSDILHCSLHVAGVPAVHPLEARDVPVCEQGVNGDAQTVDSDSDAPGPHAFTVGQDNHTNEIHY